MPLAKSDHNRATTRIASTRLRMVVAFIAR